MPDTVQRIPSRLAATLLLLAPFLSLPAQAQSPARQATDWGLLGTFAADCKVPPSRQMIHLSYVVRDDRLYYEQNYGDGRSSNEVAAARVRPDGNIEIILKFAAVSPPQTRLNVNTKRADGAFRTLESKDISTGDYSIRDGLFTATGQPSRWLTRCDRTSS